MVNVLSLYLKTEMQIEEEMGKQLTVQANCWCNSVGRESENSKKYRFYSLQECLNKCIDQGLLYREFPGLIAEFLTSTKLEISQSGNVIIPSSLLCQVPEAVYSTPPYVQDIYKSL